VSGEIDMLNHAELQAALKDSLDGTPSYLVVDLSAVTFCWVQGLALLIETETLATANGTGYALSALPACIRRHCTILWGDALPTSYRTAALAVSVIRAGRAGSAD
jgi:anti-anti-sigma regulatory factor